MIVIFERDGTLHMQETKAGVESCESCGTPIALRNQDGAAVWEEIRCQCYLDWPDFQGECRPRVRHTPERCRVARTPHPEVFLP